MKSISISAKLGSAFAILLISAALIMGYILKTSMAVSAMTERSERAEQELALSAELEDAILLAVADMQVHANGRHAAGVAALQNHLARFDSAVVRLKPLLTDPQDVALLGASVSAATAWRRASVAPLLDRLSTAERAQAEDLVQRHQTETGIDRIVAGAQELSREKYRDVEVSLHRTDVAAKADEAAVTIGIVALLAVTVALWAVLRQLLGQPVVALTRVMGELADGNNAVDVPDAARGDELGSMARAVLVFRDAALAKEEAERAKARADADQRQVVDTLADGLGRLADGDLTAEIGREFPAGYAAVKDSFNRALAALRRLVGAVAGGATAIDDGSGEIAQAAEDLARRTEGTAASLEETTAAVTQMNGRLKATADVSAQTLTHADETLATVAGGRSTANEAVAAMGRVSDSAKGIDGVIEGLDKIAFQTRVLAMNAAVEAGRAGEAGRGFAVVADLVSALAMRAEEEAQAARRQLSATQTDIGTAVAAVGRVDDALFRISDGVAGVHRLLGTMAGDHRAQSSALEEISGALTAMDRATQQNAAMVEQSSAAVRTLNHQATTLAEQASRFRVTAEPEARRLHTGADQAWPVFG